MNVTCSLCRQEFEEDRAQPTCQACPLSRACKYVRCPHCGYENPAVPGWLKAIREMVGYESTRRDTFI